MNPLFIAIGAVVAVIVIIAIVFTAKRYNNIKNNGIETEAEVSRIKEVENRDDDGNYDITYTYYVKYKTQDGQVVEAKIGHVPRFTKVGDKLRVKYVPEKPKYVILVK